MANIEIFIPFILHFAAGVPQSCNSLSLEEQFEIARKKGWSDDPDDPGGATMIDITLKTYRTFRSRKGIGKTTKEDLRKISFDEWKEILKKLFWHHWRADEIQNQAIAHLLVDWLWASGPKSIRTAQKIIGVKSDGIVGPITISHINASGSGLLFEKLYEARVEYYRKCSGAWKYLKGWLRRLNAIKPDGSFSY